MNLKLNLGLREIRAIPIKCDNLERGCDWLGTVGDLEDHLTECESSPVPCPNKCKVDHLQLLRKSVKDHLETKCPNRPYNCEHCGLRGKYASIVGEHDGECEKKLVSCPNTECGLTMDRGEMKKHIQNVCKFTEVPCKYKSIGCKVRKRRMYINKHEEEDDKAHLHMSLEKIAQLDSSLCSLTNSFGLITIKLSEYCEKKKVNYVFESHPFYCSPCGYKMSIRLYPNGNGEAQGSHVSVYLKLLEGPNDESLHWPFLGTMKLELLNQLVDSGHHVVTLTFGSDYGMHPDTSWGYIKFLPHSELSYNSARNTQYLMDDTLYFRVTVTATVKEHRPWLIATIEGT